MVILMKRAKKNLMSKYLDDAKRIKKQQSSSKICIKSNYCKHDQVLQTHSTLLLHWKSDCELWYGVYRIMESWNGLGWKGP